MSTNTQQLEFVQARSITIHANNRNLEEKRMGADRTKSIGGPKE